MRIAGLHVEPSAWKARRQRGPRLVAAAALIGASLVVPATARAEGPPVEDGRRHLAETLGGVPGDFELVYERTAEVEHSEATLWSAKYVDHRTGDIHIVYRDAAAGAIAGRELHAERVAEAVAALTPLEGKADGELLAAVDARARAGTPSAPVALGVWLEVDVGPAEQAVIDRHPELTWEGDRPLVSDLATARAIRAELARARAEARAPALEQLRADAEALGGSIGYVSTSAPLVYLDLPADRVDELAGRADVSSLGLERTWVTAMSSAGPAVQANWTGGSEDQGAGVRVAVVEYHNVRNSGDLSGRVVASHSASGSLAYTSGGLDHPTWVAGAIAGRSASFPGVAPGAVIVSSSTGGGGASLTRDRQLIAAADWAASASGGDADVVNASIGQDTTVGSEEARRYFDAIVHEDGRLAVAAAGNYTTFGHWEVLSPGTAYNVLTVGGIDDRGTAGRADDRIWYYPGSNGSNYLDRSGTSWNAHGDYNKPNVSAPAAGVQTANGLGASGTSIASPIVAGIAAQVISRLPSVALRPDATRAIIMASAINRSPMPDGSKNADHEGTGTASALWANRLLTAGDAPYGGHRMGIMSEGQAVTQDIAVVAGQKVKVVLTWNSRTSGSSIATRTDRLTADLDLRVVQPDGSVVGSYTFDNNYEWVEFTASRTGTARIELRQARFDSTAERFGLAWAKWSVGTPIRLSGTNRYATAAAVSRAHFGTNVPVAYVATGLTFPDALAGGAAAGIQGGPILLTEPSRLPGQTRDELTRLRPQRIVVLGGTAAIRASVAADLDAYTAGSVTRLAGSDRYGTSAAVSRAIFSSGVPAVFVATGESFPDALSAGPAAVMSRGPVLLTARNLLPQVVRDELARLSPQRIYLMGGTNAVSDSVKQALQAYTAAPVVRLSGVDRFATAVAVSRTFFSRPPAVYLATGTHFPDALSAVPAAGRAAAPLLLVGQATIPDPVRGELTRLFPPRCYLIGGTAVIGNSVVSQLNALLGKP